MMDETTDVSHREQVAVFVRYVLDVSGIPEIHERMIAVVETVDVTGRGLTELLLKTLETHKLSIDKLVGQGYDGGSNMKGANQGVQAHIARLNPSALFTHCYCHNLNRALINAVSTSDNRIARNFFGTVEVLYAFVEGSALRHAYFIDRQFETNGTKLHLKGLSETRWNCRAASLQRWEKGVLKAALETIEHVADTTSDGETRGKAVGLLSSVGKFEFIVCLFSLSPVLSVLNEASEYLQAEQIDFLEAVTVVSSLKAEFQELRCDRKWQTAIDKAERVASELNICTEFHPARPRKIPRKIDDGIGEGIHVNTADEMRIGFYYNILDRLSQQLSDRFPAQLSDFSFLQPKCMQVYAALYLFYYIVTIYSYRLMLLLMCTN